MRGLTTTFAMSPGGRGRLKKRLPSVNPCFPSTRRTGGLDSPHILVPPTRHTSGQVAQDAKAIADEPQRPHARPGSGVARRSGQLRTHPRARQHRKHLQPCTDATAPRHARQPAPSIRGGPCGRHQGQGIHGHHARVDPRAIRPSGRPIPLAPCAHRGGTHRGERPLDFATRLHGGIREGDSGRRLSRSRIASTRPPWPHVVRGHDGRRLRPFRRDGG